ncbi:hypothetical protein RHOER0001_4469 [Rhodococcus erythropolis SK121]|nr:hypothetical protein RHOER0001_4469 [Rhodococcus erythropolis SK121]
MMTPRLPRYRQVAGAGACRSLASLCWTMMLLAGMAAL